MGIQMLETEHGIFTNNEKTGETAEEVYARYLASKDNPLEPPKTNEELQEEIKALKSQIDEIHERLCTQQEMSSTVIAHVFGMEALKNE